MTISLHGSIMQWNSHGLRRHNSQARIMVRSIFNNSGSPLLIICINLCPLNGNCLQSSVIYKATITRKDHSTKETYIELTENDFKARYGNHNASFKHPHLRISSRSHQTHLGAKRQKHKLFHLMAHHLKTTNLLQCN